jgi:hypothetical protein
MMCVAGMLKSLAEEYNLAVLNTNRMVSGGAQVNKQISNVMTSSEELC